MALELLTDGSHYFRPLIGAGHHLKPPKLVVDEVPLADI